MAPVVTILMPAYNEQESLPGVIAELQAIQPPVDIVVVDNGSEDQTAKVAARLGVTTVFEPNRGYGSACLAGIHYLAHRKVPPQVLVICDADGADDPSDLSALTSPILNGECDLVIGSRTMGTAEDGALTPQARIGNAIATSLIEQLHGFHFTDMGPFRAIRFEGLLAMKMEDETWGWNVEMQMKALKTSLRVQEVPVHYRRRSAGTSKISGSLPGAVRAGARMLWAVYRYK